ncbi:MAG: hypothetical protein AAF497_03945 [Planctomycetota bacterium]
MRNLLVGNETGCYFAGYRPVKRSYVFSVQKIVILCFFYATCIGIAQDETDSKPGSAPVSFADLIKRHEQQTIKRLKDAADAGDAQANYEMGVRHRDGDEVVQSEELALRYFTAGARLGSPASHNQLGNIYTEGTGVPKDLTRGLEHYQAAIAGGYASACANLGWHYQHGVGVAKSVQQAISLYQKGASLGDPYGYIKLGNLYGYEGNGVPLSYEKAHAFFLKAADPVHDDTETRSKALVELGLQNYLGWGRAKSMRYAEECFRFAIESNKENGNAHYWLGKLLLETQKHSQESAKHFNIAAELDDGLALTLLGNWYADGIYYEKNVTTAIAYYKRALEQEYDWAAIGLAAIYINGNGVPKNGKLAYEYAESAAGMGNARGYYILALLHDEGLGVKQSVSMRNQYLQLGAKCGDDLSAEALNRLRSQQVIDLFKLFIGPGGSGEICRFCNGSGIKYAGVQCSSCNGSGRR